MLKVALLNCVINENCVVAVLMVDGAFVIFFHPHQGRFDRRVSPAQRTKAKKIPIPGRARGDMGALSRN